MICHQAAETERVGGLEAWRPERRRPDKRQRVTTGLRKAGNEWTDREGTGASVWAFTDGRAVVFSFLEANLSRHYRWPFL